MLEYLRPHIDLYKVDLKSFDDRHYRELGGRLAADPRHDPAGCTRSGVWVEIVTLLVPGFNDSDDGAARTDRSSSPASRRTSPGTSPRFTRTTEMTDAGEHHAGDAASAARHRAATPGFATSMPATCRAGSATWNTRTATGAASASLRGTAT